MSEFLRQPKPKILCIDDDPDIIAAMTIRLNQYEVEIHTAFFGTQGIWATVTEKPDVIITDLRMPNGDGDYVVECLKGRSDTCDMPVIVLTGRRDQQIKRWMRTLGVQSYLYKPVRIEQLLSELRKYVELQPTAVA